MPRGALAAVQSGVLSQSGLLNLAFPVLGGLYGSQSFPGPALLLNPHRSDAEGMPYQILRFTGARVKDDAIARWFDEQRPDLQAIARHWFARMRACGADVGEILHDGCPVVCVDDAPFAYVNAFTAHASVGFFHGASLPDPTRMLTGAGRYMRHVKIKPNVAINDSELDALVVAAYRDISNRLAAEKEREPETTSSS